MFKAQCQLLHCRAMCILFTTKETIIFEIYFRKVQAQLLPLKGES